MRKQSRIIGSVLVVLIAAIGFIATRRPVTIVTALHTPDEKHIHQVSAKNELGQRLTVSANSIDGIRFWLADTTKPPGNATLTLHVRPAGSGEDVRTVTGTFSQFHSETALEYYDATYSLTGTANTLYFPFTRIPGSKNQAYDFVLQANVAPAQALRIRYESDEKKFPAGSSFSSEGAEQGSLGFILYERPTIATLGIRWLLDSRHALIWPALLLIAIGVWWWPKKGTISAKTYGLAWHDRAWRSRMLWIAVGLFTVGVAMYWPATKLFYYHDDLALLARVKHFQELGQPWKILTAHDYIETDEYSHFGFYFWRPISALYTWVTFAAIGLHPAAAYGINIALMGIAASGLFFVAYSLLRSQLGAAVASLAWLAHSTKIGAAYWWSESQDIVAGVLAIFSVAAFLAWRQQPEKRALLAWSLILFAAGALAKEHVFLLPFVVFAITMFEKRWSWQHMQAAAHLVAPFLLIAGLMLAARTVALGDPTLPYVRRVDDTYSFTTSPMQVAKNVVTYTAWSAEQWLWPRADGIDSSLGSWLAQLRLQPPIYPGLVLLAAFVLALVVWWRQKEVRYVFVVGGAWWLLFLAPQLMLAHDWRFRWLYLPIFGITLLLGLAAARIPPRYRTNAGILILAGIAFYGFWQARLPERTRFYQSQSTYIAEATSQYARQASRAASDSTIYIVGVVDYETTSLNAYLFRLLDPYYPLHIVRQENPPETLHQSDIVIDMRGIDAYYPEHER